MFLPFFVPPCGVCSSERIFNALTLCMHEEGGAKLFQRSFVVIDAQAHLSRWSIVACASHISKKRMRFLLVVFHCTFERRSVGW